MKYLVLIFLLFVIGCAASRVYLSKGEELYYEKCGGCHRLYSPNEITNEKWDKIMEEMTKRSKLEDDEKRMIIQYLKQEEIPPGILKDSK